MTGIALMFPTQWRSKYNNGRILGNHLLLIFISFTRLRIRHREIDLGRFEALLLHDGAFQLRQRNRNPIENDRLDTKITLRLN